MDFLKIKVSTDDVQRDLKVLSELYSKCKDAETKGKRLRESLADGWQGDSGQAMQGVMDQWISDQEKTSAMLEEAIMQINGYLKALMERDMQLAEEINRF